MTRCDNAIRCPHVGAPPAEHYLHVRERIRWDSLLDAFRGWPTYHVAAIARARRERGQG